MILQREDFSDFKIGAFPYDKEHTAMGEYHYDPPKGYVGNWYSPITDSNYKGPAWMITLRDGIKVMESQIIERTRPLTWNMLTTGCEDWEDYTVEGEIKMLSTAKLCGIVFRYHTSLCFYSFCFEDQQIKIIKRNMEDYIILQSKDFQYTSKKIYHISIRCMGSRFEIYIDGEKMMEFEDHDFPKGRIALCANAPTQFSNIEIHTDKSSYQKLLAKQAKDKQELMKEREKYPQPLLWKTIDLRDFGAGRNIRFGDLLGNGQMHILIAQCQKRIFRDRYANISCLTAIDLEGNILWQIGEPNPEHAFITADLPFQIVDIDMDGKNEVVVSMDFKLMILEGATGKVKKSVETPLSTEPIESLYSGVPFGMYAFDHVNIDAIRICNFSGKEAPTDILIKDRYSRLYAYDQDLNFLWKYHDGITGHFPFSIDLNEDGREELIVGYNLVDADGNKIWTLPVETDHTDEIIVGNFHPEIEEKLIAMVSGEEGFIIANLEGNILVKEYIGHAQRVSIGNYRPEQEGLEIALTTFWGHQGVIYLYNGKGERLFSFEPGTNGNIITPVNWTGDGQDLILLNGNTEKGGLIDGYGRQVVRFPDDGHPDLCAEVIDLVGDCREEIVLWDNEKMYIYTQDKEFVGDKIYCPEKYPLYNASNYRGEYSWPKYKKINEK